MSTATTTLSFPRHVMGMWTLLSSMIHGGDEVLGTTKLFRRVGWVHEGRKIQLPVVSGNALGGLWRRACATAFLDAYLAAGGEPISLSAFYYLTSGGALKKSATTGMDIVSEQDLRALIPMAGIFGGAGMGKIQAGKIFIDEAVPVCRETVPRLARLWPAVEEADTAELSYRDLMEVHGYSRQDDAKNVNWLRYLQDDAREEALALLGERQASDVADDAGSPQQMRYEHEELVRGTVLWHRWGFRVDPTEEEAVALACGLLRWAERPHIGGRNARGHGNLLLDYRGVDVETRLIGDGSKSLEALDRQAPEDALSDHVTGHLDAITEVLGVL